MNYPVPVYLTPFILAGMALVITSVLLGLRRALARAAWPETDRSQAFWGLSAILIGWFAVAAVMSIAGVYQRPVAGIPSVPIGLLTPIVLGLALFLSSPLLRRVLAIIPNSWLVGVQFYRALGVIFLILYAGGHLPGLFALPAGIGDVLVGILAPFAAAAYARSPQSAVSRVRLWNLLGLSDLTIAVTTGFLTSPSPFQVAAFDRPSTLIGVFPLVLIPVFAVPLSILLHFASLRKLQQDQVAGYRAQASEQIGSGGHRAIG